jgi:transposase
MRHHRVCLISKSVKTPSTSVAGPFTPEQKIKALEVQLREAREKAQLFEAVLDVLKKDYGVRVVKKPSGKSSRKGSSQS